MEILIGLVVLIIVVAVLITALSPRDTKLFRRIWSAEKTGAIDAQHEAINELLARFDVSIPKSSDGADIDKLGDSIGRLMAKATEFDLKHQNNLGVVVSSILARNLEGRLHAAGINEFDEQLKMMANVDVAQMAKSMEKPLNVLGKIKTTIDLFKNQITHGKEEKNREKYGVYLIGYSYGIVQEMCKFDGAECSDLNLTPVLQEVQRIFGKESDNIFEETRTQLDEIVATKLGAQGLADGLVDGSYVSNPKNPAPYFGRLVSFFED